MGAHWFRRSLALWLPVAGAATVLSLTVYAGVQQVQRSDADDPQVQMASDAAAALAAGVDPSQVASGTPVDIATSLAPWLVVYGEDGAPRASTGTFEGHAPVVPDSVLTDAANGRLAITWEPRDGLRFATVAVAYPGGTVVAARSMLEVEQREARSLEIAGLGWLCALGAAAIGAVAGVWLRDRGAQAH